MNPTTIAQALISAMNLIQVLAQNQHQEVSQEFLDARSALAQELADEAQRLADE